jgi:hypothetical protein
MSARRAGVVGDILRIELKLFAADRTGIRKI